MNIGIVGHEAAKFTAEGERAAKHAILKILVDHADMYGGRFNFDDDFSNLTVVSGACHLGGIDVWAEEIADKAKIKKLIYPPKRLDWSGGFKPRNIQIAAASDIVYCVVVNAVPLEYAGMRFDTCYHCNKRGLASHTAEGFAAPHIKSGGCWTAWHAVEKLQKNAKWIVIDQT